MNKFEITVPEAGVLFDFCKVIEWCVEDLAKVTKGEVIARLETSDLNLDLEAQRSGVLRQKDVIGKALASGDVIGLIVSD